MSMEQQHGGGASNSSHDDDEGILKDEKGNNNNRRNKRVIGSSSSPSPSTSYNHETHKNDGGGNDNEKDDIKEDENLTPSTAKDVNKQGKELESTKAEIGEVMEENQRLKQYLNQIMSDYQMLQSKFVEISQQDSKQLIKVNQTVATSPPPRASCDGHDDEEEDQELVSLSLGRSSSLDSKKGYTNKLSSPTKLATNHNKDIDMEANERSLDLGLECKFKASSTLDHPQTLNLNETKDDEALKNNKNITGGSSNGDDELVHQPPMKKARVSVRVRCDTPTMNDGCQWRKYGQKIAKGNPCPRAYYRCTVAPSCPVRKQVQRCAEDMSILITTYEGAHNHPLPVSATAMASTTSAAAYMLMSKSSTSSNPGSHPSTTTTTTPIGEQLHGGLNKFNVLNNFEQNPFFPPNSSTYSPTPIHPTVTLDLTSTPLSSTNNQFNKVAPNLGSRFSSTNLTFNFSENSNNNPLYSWPNNGLPSYDSQSYIKKTLNNPLNIGSSNNTYNFQSSLLQKSIYPPNSSLNRDSLPDSFAQAAKVLTSDPSFQSILTATLSSFIIGNNGNANSKLVGNNHEGEGNAKNTSFMDTINKWGGFHTSSTNSSQFQSTSKDTNGCISSLSNKVPIASNSELARSHKLLTPSLPFSSTKSTSSSPDDINQTN